MNERTDGHAQEIETLLADATQPELWTACEDEDDGLPLVCLRAGDEHAGPVIWRDGDKAVCLTLEDARLIAAAPRLLREFAQQLREKDAEIQRLMEEMAVMGRVIAAKSADIAHWRERAGQLGEKDAQIAALVRYVRHDDDCTRQNCKGLCSCGMSRLFDEGTPLSALLTAPGKP